MASQEQLELSTFIKKVHANLRRETKINGSKLAWQNHCTNENNLKKYSSAMLELATNYWDKNVNDCKLNNRIIWTLNFCENYFQKGNIEIFRKKDISIASTMNFVIKEDFIEQEQILNLLDVGSCYNPFKINNNFAVTAIDIAPATDDVINCDFLNVKIKNDFKYHENTIQEMPQNYFHIVIFSLLLEYLPTPTQRHLSCEKAYDLLKTEGILIVITPDSKHSGANVKIMKSWRHILAKIGFQRIKYEKMNHIHCMVFRKCLNKEISIRWSNLHNKDDIFTEIHIPQDFNIISVDPVNCSAELVVDIDLFKQLPSTDVIN